MIVGIFFVCFAKENVTVSHVSSKYFVVSTNVRLASIQNRQAPLPLGTLVFLFSRSVC